MAPLRVALLFSGSASSWRYLRDHDPNYGKTYEIVGAFTDRPKASAIPQLAQAQIPLVVHGYRGWCKANGVRPDDQAARGPYFSIAARALEEWEANLVMCSGFMLLVTEPLLSRFPLLNVHPANLTILNGDGTPRYAGLRVVDRQIIDQVYPQSTVHFMTAEVDGGPILALSRAYPAQTGERADHVQDAMKTACDGPAYQLAFAKLAASFAARDTLPKPSEISSGNLPPELLVLPAPFVS
jgi:folate-dependent phosphoribosylglycinamide formyltransferase PurN